MRKHRGHQRARVGGLRILRAARATGDITILVVYRPPHANISDLEDKLYGDPFVDVFGVHEDGDELVLVVRGFDW